MNRKRVRLPRFDYGWCDGCEYERPYCERRMTGCPDECKNVYHNGELACDSEGNCTGKQQNHCHCHVPPTSYEKREGKCKFYKARTKEQKMFPIIPAYHGVIMAEDDE